MPCNGDYLDPTAREAESKKVCGLLVYVLRELGQEIPEKVSKAAKEYYGDEKHLDANVASLCKLLRGLSKTAADRIIYDGRSRRARQLANWWEKHQRADKQRIQNEKNEAKVEAVRKRAIGKLTPLERKVLGLA